MTTNLYIEICLHVSLTMIITYIATSENCERRKLIPRNHSLSLLTFSLPLSCFSGDWKAARSAAALFAPHQLLQTPVDKQNYCPRSTSHLPPKSSAVSGTPNSRLIDTIMSAEGNKSLRVTSRSFVTLNICKKYAVMTVKQQHWL